MKRKPSGNFACWDKLHAVDNFGRSIEDTSRLHRLAPIGVMDFVENIPKFCRFYDASFANTNFEDDIITLALVLRYPDSRADL